MRLRLIGGSDASLFRRVTVAAGAVGAPAVGAAGPPLANYAPRLDDHSDEEEQRCYREEGEGRHSAMA